MRGLGSGLAHRKAQGGRGAVGEVRVAGVRPRELACPWSRKTIG